MNKQEEDRTLVTNAINASLGNQNGVPRAFLNKFNKYSPSVGGLLETVILSFSGRTAGDCNPHHFF